MSFDRQLNLLITLLVAVVVFFGCAFYWSLSIAASLLIAVGVFLGGLLFGRRIAGILELPR